MSISPAFINAETHYYGRGHKNQVLSVKLRSIFHLCLLGRCNRFKLLLPPCLPLTWNSDSTQHSPPTCLCMKPAVLEISYPGRKEIEKKKKLYYSKGSNTPTVCQKEVLLYHGLSLPQIPSLPPTLPVLQLKHSYVNLPIIFKYFTVTYRWTSSATAVLGGPQSAVGSGYLWQEAGLWHQRQIL